MTKKNYQASSHRTREISFDERKIVKNVFLIYLNARLQRALGWASALEGGDAWVIEENERLHFNWKILFTSFLIILFNKYCQALSNALKVSPPSAVSDEIVTPQTTIM